ncbi:MAG: LCP family protein, partial [Clostridium sp.]
MGENNEMKKRNTKSNKQKMTKKKKAIIISLSVVAVIIASVLGGYLYIRNRIYVEPTEPKIELSEEEKIKYKEVDGITNVLLIGTDGRTLDENSRSDAMIIATLDNNNKKIKLTSIMRDTLVDIPGYGEQKINAAFAFGGPELLMETIKNTFEINLDKYIIVNFWGFEAIIDQIGGIDVDIKEYEIENINEYIGEATQTKSDPITKPGLQTLNGAQALSYSRIRSVGNASYERSERQRTVINKVAEKLVTVNPLKYPGIANEMSKHIRTNIDPL